MVTRNPGPLVASTMPPPSFQFALPTVVKWSRLVPSNNVVQSDAGFWAEAGPSASVQIETQMNSARLMKSLP